MAQARDIRKVQLYIIITIASLVGGGFALMRLIQRNRARKVDKNISLALSNPNLTVDEKGDVVENGGNGVISGAVAQSKAKALVDDIWGYTFTIKKNIWDQLMNYDDSEFASIVAAANGYIATKPSPTIGSKPKNFYQLVTWETSPRLNSGAITSRITRLGLN
jgi:hypothetical protein